jgi:beta-lactamase superfamily II metal-dependent hydrolase
MDIEGLEIDFLAVGNGEKSGDAIAFRYGNLNGHRDEQTVIVVDGGFTDDGEALVQHIRTHFGTNRVDIVVSTHPDADHVNGLKVVLKEMEVGLLLMHLPWTRSPAVEESKRMKFASPKVDDKFERNFAAASELEDIARERGIAIIEPFTGMSTPDGKLTILSPTEEFYGEMMEAIADSERSITSSVLTKLAHSLSEAAQKVVPESLHIETLTDKGDTSPQNNTSVVCLIRAGGKSALLTGDAGIPALERAAAHLDSLGIGTGSLSFVQVPHHGSRRNVGPTVLNRLLGPKGQENRLGTAFVSAAKDSKKHPAKKVTNAFTRRGYPVHGTEGQGKRHAHNAPARQGWSASTAYPLHTTVEDDEG